MGSPVVSRIRVITPDFVPRSERVKPAVLYNESEDMCDPLFNAKSYMIWKDCLQIPDSRLKAMLNKIDGADQKFSRFLHDLRSENASPVRCELASLEDRVYEWIASLCIYAKIDNIHEVVDDSSERSTRVKTGFEMIEKWGSSMTSIGKKLVNITKFQSSVPQKTVAIQAELREEMLSLVLDLIPILHADKFKKCFLDLNKFLEELPLSQQLDEACSTITDDHFRRTLLGWDKPSSLSNPEEMKGAILDLAKYAYGSNLKKEVVAEVDQSKDEKSEFYKIVSELKNEKSELTKLVSELKGELSSMKGSIETLHSKIHKLEKENAQLRSLKVERSFRESDETQTSMALDRLSQLEGEIRTCNSLFSELNDSYIVHCASFFNGYTVWKVPGLKQHRRNAVSGKVSSVYSPPFYTVRDGYKMSIRAYLNGEGDGKSTHLSIFFFINRGDYDAILKWPFDLKVTIQLINQSNQDRSISFCFLPDKDKNPASFARPVTDQNPSMGFPKFAPLSILENEEFVKDDVMFIRCKVAK